MEYQELGSTGLKISRLGFGCWAMGGSRWGRVDDQDSIAAVREALDLGINFFDTADVYGFGHSEEVLCRALGEDRKRVIIATKFGVGWDVETGRTHRDCSPRRVVEALEGSLRRLRLDCIPLYQIHWPDASTPIASTMEALGECQRAGKVRYVGCSNFTAELLREAQGVLRVESLQLPYSLLNRDGEECALGLCRKLNMGLLAYGVLGHGLLSGKYSHCARFPEDDFRGESEEFRGERLRRNLLIVDRLREVGKRYEKSPGEVAIRWVLDSPFVTCALVGIRTPFQAQQDAGAMGWRLCQADREYLCCDMG